MVAGKSTSKAGRPYEDSAIAVYLTRQIDAIQSQKTQREIASEIGYDKPNMISMFKRGETKIPLDKIPLLAKALHVDPQHLFRLALEQYWPTLDTTVRQLFGNTVSDNEMEIVREVRRASKNTDPRLDAKSKAAIKDAFTRK